MSRTPVGDRVRLYGIRHHGPGSARCLVAALDDWQPDVVLVEGPPEAEALVPYLLDDATKPPVALLMYVADTPRWASYYPMVEFSPELQAFRWAARNDRPVRLMDLPASASLGLSVVPTRHKEAMELVAEAAGFEDVEDWWEHLVEHRQDANELFEGIEALMCALRESNPYSEVEEDEGVPDDGRVKISDQQFEAMREAHMRRTLRGLIAEGHERIAVVCGAWHVPALRELPPAKQDDALLKGMPKLKVGATVVPWSYDHLTFASGYGAGVRSPAFYNLLWQTGATGLTTQWLLLVARLMRDEDLDASPASVIEAIRLAEALAALRGRPHPGLKELCEAAGSVLVHDQAIWQLIGDRLIVGEGIGEVPESVPMMPLQADLAASQKRLRMKVDSTDRKLELDLRGEIDLERSYLLHRLSLLGVEWGIEEEVRGKQGTFHEHWRLQWRPELVIGLIEASLYGNTVVSAASNFATAQADEATNLAVIARLVERVLIAGLDDAVAPTVAKLQALSATGADVADLAEALPPLAGVVRYGNVRRTEAEQVVPVLDAIFTRLCVGLPSACTSLDDEAALAMMTRMGSVTNVVTLFSDDEKTALWLSTLEALANQMGCHGLVVGKAERLRFDLGATDGDFLALRLGQEASTGATALHMAAFLEGLLDGPGAVLLYQESLMGAVDGWIVGLPDDVFDETLPLIRRTFARFAKPERRQIGERVSGGVRVSPQVTDLDDERAQRVLPVIRQILGLSQ